MPRRKSAPSKATPVSTRPPKRQLSESSPASTAATPGSRSSKRLKETAGGSKTTPTKSKYFEDPGSDEPETADEVENSGYEDEDASVTEEKPSSSDDLESEGDDYDSEEEDVVKKRRGGARKKATTKGNARSASGTATASLDQGKELWRPGIKTGLGPGKAVFIEKPKPRGDGGIKYVPGKIHPNTMAFLKDLKNNNDREWLKSKSRAPLTAFLPLRGTTDWPIFSGDCRLGPCNPNCYQRLTFFSGLVHDPDYRQSWKDWESFVETLTEKISEIDETIPELPPKDLVLSGPPGVVGPSTDSNDARCSESTAISGFHRILLLTRSVRCAKLFSLPVCLFQIIDTLSASFLSCMVWFPPVEEEAVCTECNKVADGAERTLCILLCPDPTRRQKLRWYDKYIRFETCG